MTSTAALDGVQISDVFRAFRHAETAARLVGDTDPIETHSAMVLRGLAAGDAARAAQSMLDLVDEFEVTVEDTVKHSDTDESTDAAALAKLADARRALRVETA